MQPPSVTSHIHEHVDLHTSLILFLVPVSSGVEAAGRYRPGSPERVGWGMGLGGPNDSSTDADEEAGVRCSLAVIAACPQHGTVGGRRCWFHR